MKSKSSSKKNSTRKSIKKEVPETFYRNLIDETERMNAVEHFISGTAQEIRNPLKALFERLNKLLKDYEGKDFEYIGFKEYRNMFNVIRSMRDQAKYCYETTDRLLRITKRKMGIDGNFCFVDAVLREAVESVKHSFEESKIKIELKLPKRLPQAAIGTIELRQVIVNILTNAIQSITHAGHILLKAEYLKKNRVVVIECSDNGVGISKENLAKVFDPFYTTKHRGLEKSSGLGLSIVYSIVKAHKGDIQIKSTLRSGTRVRLTFPAAKRKK